MCHSVAQDGPLRYLDPWDCETLLNTFTWKENADFERKGKASKGEKNLVSFPLWHI